MTHAIRLRRLGRAAGAGTLAVAAAVAGLTVGGGGGRTIAAEGEPLGAGGEYHPITPVRILDTRDPELDTLPGDATPQRIVTSTDGSTTFDVQVAGAPGLPEFAPATDGTDANVLAVAVNITVINPTQPGFLQAYGTGAAAGTTSLVNFYPGEFVPNSAILRPGDGGKLTINVQTPPAVGAADVAIDLFGWFSSSNYVDESEAPIQGARIVPAGPERIFDSRDTGEAGEVPLGPTEQVAIPIRGANDSLVPDDESVTGVLVNITGINNLDDSEPTFLSVVPSEIPEGETPSTSNVNLLPGLVRSVMAMVPVGDDGNVHLYNLAGAVHVAVDVVGYMQEGADPSTRQGRVVPLVAPYRAIDTRAAHHGARPLMSGQAENWSFASFIADVSIDDNPVGAQIGVLGNLTATELSRQYPTAVTSTFLTAYPPPGPGDPAVPEVSNITITEGQTMPNLALLRFGASESDDRCTDPVCVRFYNLAGGLHYLFDASAVILAD